MYDRMKCECTLPAYEKHILNSPYKCCEVIGRQNYWGTFGRSISSYVASGGSQGKAMYQLRSYGK